MVKIVYFDIFNDISDHVMLVQLIYNASDLNNAVLLGVGYIITITKYHFLC